MTAVRRRERRPRLGPIAGRIHLKFITDAEVLLRSIVQDGLPDDEVGRDLVPAALERMEAELALSVEADAETLSRELQKGQPRGVQVGPVSVKAEGRRLVSEVTYHLEDLKMLPLIRGAESERPFRSLRFDREAQSLTLSGVAFEGIVSDGSDPPEVSGLGLALTLEVACPVSEHDAEVCEPHCTGSRLRWWFGVERTEPPRLHLRLHPSPVGAEPEATRA